jgi:hypothetical protein
MMCRHVNGWALLLTPVHGRKKQCTRRCNDEHAASLAWSDVYEGSAVDTKRGPRSSPSRSLSVSTRSDARRISWAAPLLVR